MSEMTGTLSGESPLVPNQAMLHIYQGMVASRMLLQALRKRSGKSHLADLRGQEACRASALAHLTTADFVSDHTGLPLSALLLGAEPGVILNEAPKKHTHKKHAGAPQSLFADAASEHACLLPALKSPSDSVRLALGSALALRRLQHPGVCVVFTAAGELKPSLWREFLRLAAHEELPVLFVVLPAAPTRPDAKAERATAPFELSSRATELGVPGIPVDSSDAIALYRVVQESLGRARAGGGPALMECIPLELALHDKSAQTDPIDAMGEMLQLRKVRDAAWIEAVAPAFQARLDAL